MNEPCCMEIMHSKQQLVDNILFMYFFECSFVDCMIEVSVHEFKDEIDVAGGEGGQDLVKPNDVGVVDLLQDGNLTEGSLGISAVLECLEDFFEGEELGGLIIFGHFPNMPICS